MTLKFVCFILYVLVYLPDMVLTDKDLEKKNTWRTNISWHISSRLSGHPVIPVIPVNSVIWPLQPIRSSGHSGPPAIPVIPSSGHSSHPVIPAILVIPLGCSGSAFIFFSLQSELKRTEISLLVCFKYLLTFFLNYSHFSH